MIYHSTRTALLAVLLATTLSGCSPQYDWRDYHSAEAPYTVLFPGKPASQTRAVTLDTLKLDMTMTAAEVDGVVFAVGSARLPDGAPAMPALQTMQLALVNNIGGTLRSSKDHSSGLQAMLEFEAEGKQRGQPARLIGRLIARDQRVYQIIILERGQKLAAEQIDTYFTSFKLN